MPRTKRDYAERLAEIEQREAAAKVKIDAIRKNKLIWVFCGNMLDFQQSNKYN